MDVNSLNQFRREGLVQRLLIVATVLGIGLLFLVINLFSSFFAQPRSGEPAIEERQPVATSPQESMSAAATEDADNVSYESTPENSVTPLSEEQTEYVEEPTIVAATEIVETTTEAANKDHDIVAGIAIRSGHNTPLRSLRLRLINSGGKQVAVTRTGRDGSFAFSKIATGKYYLETVSENFSHRTKPIIVSDSAPSEVSFEVTPNAPAVKLPEYVEFRWGSEVPNLEVKIFRFSKVSYKLFQLRLSESFVNVTSVNDMLGADVSELSPLDEFSRRYTYSVSFSELTDKIDFDLDSPGLYLLEARAGTDSFRSLISVSELKVVTTQSGSILQVLVMGLATGAAQPSALVKAVQNGRMLSEYSTNSSGMVSVDFISDDVLELLVSDGRSFVYMPVSYHQPRLAIVEP